MQQYQHVEVADHITKLKKSHLTVMSSSKCKCSKGRTSSEGVWLGFAFWTGGKRGTRGTGDVRVLSHSPSVTPLQQRGPKLAELKREFGFLPTFSPGAKLSRAVQYHKV